MNRWKTGFRSTMLSKLARPIMAGKPPKNASLNVTWSDVVHFIRQLTHDLRNDLNAIELQSAYIAELETNEEIQGDIKRLREMTSGLASTLQRLSRVVEDVAPNVIPYRAADLMEDLRKTIERNYPTESAEISWDIRIGHEMLNVDPQLLEEVFIELFANAFRHDRGKGPLLATARAVNNQLVFTLCEPKEHFDLPTENWGREPLRKISRRQYGLGLNHARAIVEAHGGELRAEHDASRSILVTRVAFPISAASGSVV